MSLTMAGCRAPGAQARCAPAGTLDSVIIEIGEIPIALRVSDTAFRENLERRYAGFVNPSARPAYRFDIELDSRGSACDEDARVFQRGSVWHFERGDFRAVWDGRSRRGSVRQSPNPYSIDTVLRIAHSLVLAEEGGFLIHAASAVRGGRAYLFAGVSGAGKTTLARLAPPDADVLTDEISYVRRCSEGYRAYGTPFAGELARVGANLSAPLDALFLLEQAAENGIHEVTPRLAARALMRHILFFAADATLVNRVFLSAVEFVSRARVARLAFRPEPSSWDFIR
jgi:hypothetical protein